MKLPLSWLKDYTNIDGISLKEYAAALTMSGSKVEGIENLGAEIDNVVTGEILSVEKHPDSDHLVICQLNVGQEEPVQIVTGAPNITPETVGCICPVALHKSTLPGGVKITKGKLRGVLVPGTRHRPRLRTVRMREWHSASARRHSGRRRHQGRTGSERRCC